MCEMRPGQKLVWRGVLVEIEVTASKTKVPVANSTPVPKVPMRLTGPRS
jgi:hypothetical protein